MVTVPIIPLFPLFIILGVSPQAKVTWKNLSPNERRDVVSLVDEVDGKEATKERIKKVILMLKNGKLKLI